MEIIKKENHQNDIENGSKKKEKKEKGHFYLQF